MKISLSLGLVLAAAALPAQNNVLLIVLDDIGVDGIAAYNIGSAPAPTPNITALANRGVLFRNAYAQPSCSPTRAAIHTGRYAFRTGVNAPGDVLSLSEVALPEILPSTHARALIGKWHLGSVGTQGATYPNQTGWTHFSGALGGGVPNYYRWFKVTNGTQQTITNYATTETVNDAISWIRGQTRPWVVSLNLHAPHTPYHAPPANLHSYNLTGLDPQQQPLPFYKAMIEAADREVGRLFQEIGATTVANTDIILIGDNGTSNGVLESPYTGQGKGSLRQAGTNVPLIVAGPTVQSPGRTSSALVHVVDLFHTVAELTGVDARAAVPAQVELDGVSFVPHLTDPNHSPVRETVYVDQVDQAGNRNGMLRDARYKFHQANGGDEFYDLQVDPYEQNNLLQGAMSAAVLERFLYLSTEVERLQGEAAWVGFGEGCPGAAGVPVLLAARGSVPVLGSTLMTRIRNFDPGVTQFLGLLSLTQFAIDVTPYGAPGCTLYADLVNLTPLMPNGRRVDWNVQIPAEISLVGARFYQQVIVFEAGVNVHDAILTNAAVGLIGPR